MLAVAAGCVQQPWVRDAEHGSEMTLSQESTLFRERPFLLGAEAATPDFVLAAEAYTGAPDPDCATRRVVVVRAMMKSLSEKHETSIPVHARLNAVISPGGEIMAGSGWTATGHAYRITGLKPAGSLSVKTPVAIPIVAPRGEPYVIDILLKNASQRVWHTFRFVDFTRSPFLNNLVASAAQQVGRPYVWGGVNDHGAGTRRSLWNGRRVTGFDCSGLIIYLYRQIGIDITWRTTAEQWNNLPDVENADLLPGDLVFFADRQGKIYHVGMLLGDIGSSPDQPEPDGQWDMIHAPARNQTVRVEYGFMNGPLSGVAGFKTVIGVNGYTGY